MRHSVDMFRTCQCIVNCVSLLLCVTHTRCSTFRQSASFVLLTPRRFCCGRTAAELLSLESLDASCIDSSQCSMQQLDQYTTVGSTENAEPEDKRSCEIKGGKCRAGNERPFCMDWKMQDRKTKDQSRRLNCAVKASNRGVFQEICNVRHYV